MSSDDTIEIVCRDREEFIEDYLMVVFDYGRLWCEEMADAYEAVTDDPYPAVFTPKEDEFLDD